VGHSIVVLLQVLKRTRDGGSALIRVEQLVDGFVAFVDESDAHRYKSLLEADGMEEVTSRMSLRVVTIVVQLQVLVKAHVNNSPTVA
jgi:hypothetical protein